MKGDASSHHQDRVDEFMKLAGQEVPEYPCIPSEEVRRLCAKLILEEVLETVKALGFVVHTASRLSFYPLEIDELLLSKAYEPNLIEIVDGCCDLRVVTTGTLSACGIDDIPVQAEVDESNLRKFGDGGYKREDGKWMKPDDWEPPALRERLLEQGWEE